MCETRTHCSLVSAHAELIYKINMQVCENVKVTLTQDYTGKVQIK